MDSNTLYLDPDPEFLPNLDLEPVIGSGTGDWIRNPGVNNFDEKNYFL